ncbi:paramyosin-like [Watersipora subatra]|uniref:paramyosin-like n=1 Tax=Watersipora subatra TaxID=2589382 RepID=UPI00355AEAF1
MSLSTLLNIRDITTVRVGELQLEVGELQLEVGELQLEVGELQLVVGELQLEVGELQLVVGELQLEVGELQLEVGELQLVVGELQLEVGELQLEVVELQLEVGELQLEVGELQLELEVGELQLEVVELQLEVVELQLEVVELQLEVVELQLEVGELQLEVVELQLEVGELQLEVGELQLEVGKLQLEVVELQLEVVELQLEVVELQLEVVELQLELEVGKLQLEVGELQLDIWELQEGGGRERGREKERKRKRKEKRERERKRSYSASKEAIAKESITSQQKLGGPKVVLLPNKHQRGLPPSKYSKHPTKASQKPQHHDLLFKKKPGRAEARRSSTNPMKANLGFNGWTTPGLKRSENGEGVEGLQLIHTPKPSSSEGKANNSSVLSLSDEPAMNSSPMNTVQRTTRLDYSGGIKRRHSNERSIPSFLAMMYAAKKSNTSLQYPESTPNLYKFSSSSQNAFYPFAHSENSCLSTPKNPCECRCDSKPNMNKMASREQFNVTGTNYDNLRDEIQKRRNSSLSEFETTLKANFADVKKQHANIECALKNRRSTIEEEVDKKAHSSKLSDHALKISDNELKSFDYEPKSSEALAKELRQKIDLRNRSLASLYKELAEITKAEDNNQLARQKIEERLAKLNSANEPMSKEFLEETISFLFPNNMDIKTFLMTETESATWNEVKALLHETLLRTNRLLLQALLKKETEHKVLLEAELEQIDSMCISYSHSVNLWTELSKMIVTASKNIADIQTELSSRRCEEAAAKERRRSIQSQLHTDYKAGLGAEISDMCKESKEIVPEDKSETDAEEKAVVFRPDSKNASGIDLSSTKSLESIVSNQMERNMSLHRQTEMEQVTELGVHHLSNSPNNLLLRIGRSYVQKPSNDSFVSALGPNDNMSEIRISFDPVTDEDDLLNITETKPRSSTNGLENREQSEEKSVDLVISRDIEIEKNVSEQSSAPFKAATDMSRSEEPLQEKERDSMSIENKNAAKTMPIKQYQTLDGSLTMQLEYFEEDGTEMRQPAQVTGKESKNVNSISTEKNDASTKIELPSIESNTNATAGDNTIAVVEDAITPNIVTEATTNDITENSMDTVTEDVADNKTGGLEPDEYALDGVSSGGPFIMNSLYSAKSRMTAKSVESEYESGMLNETDGDHETGKLKLSVSTRKSLSTGSRSIGGGVQIAVAFNQRFYGISICFDKNI